MKTIRTLLIGGGFVTLLVVALVGPTGVTGDGPLRTFVPLGQVQGASGSPAAPTRTRTATPPSGSTVTATPSATATTPAGPSATPTRTSTVTATPTESALGICAPLVVNPGALVAGAVTDQYLWYDASCRRRSASLVRSDPKGGNATQFTYRLADGTVRTVGASGEPNAAGFGYVVSHLYDASLANNNGDDDSPLGSSLKNGFRSVFSGTNHAIHEFTLDYPRWGVDPVTLQTVKYSMPVTIHWMFATGRSYPLWAVTFDLSAAPANAIRADTRAPYGDMNFDGAPAGTFGDELGGVGWGDSHRFKSTSVPFTLNSAWTWALTNAFAPYNAIWTRNTDAEMGIAGTRVIARQDAGGYEGANGRGSQSGAGKGCPPGEGDDYLMPCDWEWSYQSVNYSFYNDQGQLQKDSPTGSKRLAWGADWGSLGQQSFTSINGNTVSGWPKVSYSVYIVLDPHNLGVDGPTVLAASEAQAINGTTLTASVGTVATNGPAGPGRTDTVTYAPAGYNHVYGTWEAIAASNRATLSFAVGALQITNPVVVLRNYTGAANPPTVTLNGATLAPNVDYFSSLRPGSQELWITIKRSMTGNNSLVIAN